MLIPLLKHLMLSSRHIATTMNDVTNTSFEEIAISDENFRLRNLLDTGMLKSLKGHQTLCDVLKKLILHKKPQKGRFGFRKETQC
jgi:hypothetical protein